MVLNSFSYIPVLGLPLFVWFGIVGLILIILAVVAIKLRKKYKFSMKLHTRTALIGLVLTTIHGILRLILPL